MTKTQENSPLYNEWLCKQLDSEACRNGGDGAYAWRARDLCGKAKTLIETLNAEKAKLERDRISVVQELDKTKKLLKGYRKLVKKAKLRK